MAQIDNKEKELKNINKNGTNNTNGNNCDNNSTNGSPGKDSNKKKCSSPTKIGMNCITIERLIENLPNADKCKNYKFKHRQDKKEIQEKTHHHLY